MKLTPKDRSLILFVVATIIVIWVLFSATSYLFFNLSFSSSKLKNIGNQAAERWFNVSRALLPDDLKDRIVLLHFWGYSCLLCEDNLSEIKKLEQEFGSRLTVIGVHVGKNKASDLRKAMLRYDISHPVLNDYDLAIWNEFKIKSIPTAILFNPNGKIFKVYNKRDELRKLRSGVVKLTSRFKYKINRDPLPVVLEKYDIGRVLNFPTKLEYTSHLPNNSRQIPAIFISDTGHNKILVTTMSGNIIDKIGTGKVGFTDGDFNQAAFNSPGGMVYKGGKLYVADTRNHALRVIDFESRKVSTLIGNGKQGVVVKDDKQSKSKDSTLAYPLDLELFQKDKNDIIAISNVATNQILAYDLDKKHLSVLAGNGAEGTTDGKYPQNSLAQPNGLSYYNQKLYFVDAKSSALRVLDIASGEVKTLIEGNLEADYAKSKPTLLQHPGGVLADDTGIYISDRFDHSIKKYDLRTKHLSSFAGGKSSGDRLGSNTEFDEPDGLISVIDRFYVADANNHRVVIIRRDGMESELFSVMPPLKVPKEGLMQYLPNLQKPAPVKVKSENDLVLKIVLKQGWRLNENGPSFINLLEMVKSDRANLLDSFDWKMIRSKEINLPKLKNGKDYVLQGSIYYCEDKKNALCYIKSYEQHLIPQNDEKSSVVEIKLGN